MSDPFEHQAPDDPTVAAYLANRLDAAHAEAFEAYCLRHPEFARRVEADLCLKTGLREMQEPDLVRRTWPERRIALAVAAGLILILGCGLLLTREHAGGLVAYRSETEVPSPLLSGTRVSITLIRLRSGAPAHRVVAPQGTGVLALRVLPESPPGHLGYTAEVAFDLPVLPPSVTMDKLSPDADGYIKVYLPFADVVGKTLKVTVTPSPPTGTAPLSFRLQVAYRESTPDDSH